MLILECSVLYLYFIFIKRLNLTWDVHPLTHNYKIKRHIKQPFQFMAREIRALLDAWCRRLLFSNHLWRHLYCTHWTSDYDVSSGSAQLCLQHFSPTHHPINIMHLFLAAYNYMALSQWGLSAWMFVLELRTFFEADYWLELASYLYRTHCLNKFIISLSLYELALFIFMPRFVVVYNILPILFCKYKFLITTPHGTYYLITSNHSLRIKPQ